MTISYIPKVNQRITGAEVTITNEAHIVGITGLATVTTNQIRLYEVPLQETPSSVIISGFLEITSGTPGVNEFIVDYENGRITFNAIKNGVTVFVNYKGRGSLIDAEDINELQSVVGGIADLDGTLGTGVVTPDTISTNPSHNFTFPNNVIVTGDLTVQGSATTLNTEVVTIEDNIILLNSNVTGAPSVNSGIEVKRGTSPNVQLIWDEADDSWALKGSSGSAILKALDTGSVAITGVLKPFTDSTTGLKLSNVAGTSIVTVDTTNSRLGLNTTPVATFHNAGSTVLGLTTATNPGSITATQVNNNSGIVITTSSSISVTLPSPTNTTLGRFFTVLHTTTSTGTLSVDGKNLGIGKGMTFLWSGSNWIVVGATGGFEVVATLPVSPVQGDVAFLTTTSQFMGYNGTSWVVVG